MCVDMSEINTLLPECNGSFIFLENLKVTSGDNTKK